MRIVCNLMKENNVITFQDLRNKHADVIGAQGELRRGLINVAIRLRATLENSLSLPQRQWKNPATDEMVDYVYTLAEKNGKAEATHPHEMNFDERMGVSFLLAVTIDKAPTSFPKTTMAVPVRVDRHGEVYIINLRKGEYETSIPLEFCDSDFSDVCEVIKQFILKDLDGYIPS
ncbi:hypothetical protein M8Q70_002948 [Salmonella enterica]|nr:hypothetical protein [Salmonella enterica subsp. enterica serovar Telelkebir]EGB2526598.1 hypothetical protein [Salmonella enterica]EHB3482525.1 hypothetical protein [Salmonella enterica subsp. enterica serovar Newport]MIN79522.1 hypothetical protein [Salmonella enterica subsp. enterica]ECZ9741627.1 hypothetical protein [Salmonella enterica subsp. enterica serovar Telelkebir]